MKKKFKVGDIFSIPIEGGNGYLFGQIMLDLKKQCIKPKLILRESPLYFFGECILVDVFCELSQNPVLKDYQNKIIKGVMVFPDAIEEGIYTVIENREVNYEEVDFPESISFMGMNNIFFMKGELEIKLNISREYAEKNIGVNPTINSSYALEIMGLYALDKKHLMEEKYRTLDYLKKSDLRYNTNKRVEVFNLMNENPDQSYYDFAKRYNFDLARFYK